ncbi:MAG: hypothetical protein WCQ60_01170 [bacterium]
MKVTPESIAFFHMVQQVIETNATSYIGCFDKTTPTELAEARTGAKITEAELFFENRGLINGGDKVGSIEYRGFTLKGRSINGMLFEVYGQVGRKQGQPQWCAIGVKVKYINPEVEGFIASGRGIIAGYRSEDNIDTCLSYCHEDVPFRMCRMADRRTDFVQWCIENMLADAE